MEVGMLIFAGSVNMEIRNWPMDRIMQLPDHCFGRRFSVIFSGSVGAFGTSYFISELSLPDRCVLWELNMFSRTATADIPFGQIRYSFKLGTKLPASDAEVALLDDIEE